MKLAIAIPTYNESTNIKKLLPAIKKNLDGYPNLTTTVFVIDDNSPDGTGKITEDTGKKLRDKSFKVEVIHRKVKDGFGKAYVFGFKKILTKDFDYIMQMDADLSHDPKYLPQFLDATNDVNFVVGSRYIEGGSTPDWQLHRRLLSRGGNTYTRIMLDSKITDYTGGYNLYSSDLLQAVDPDSLQTAGYGFLIELKYRALGKSDGIKQVPIVFMDRQHGNSKIPKGIILKNLALVANLKFKG